MSVFARLRIALVLCLAALSARAVFAFQPRKPSRFDALILEDPSTVSATTAAALSSLPETDPLRAGWSGFTIAHGPDWRVWLDPRSGAPLLVEGQGIPWIPGSGNGVAAGAAPTLQSLEGSLRSFAAANRGILLADDSELVLDAGASGQITPDLWQIVFSRRFGGVPVAGDRYSFTIGHGNLIAFGAPRWSRIALASTVPSLSADEAIGRLADYMKVDRSAIVVSRLPELRVVPFPESAPNGQSAFGSGWSSALCWSLAVRVGDDPGTWAALVDGGNGAIRAFFDDNRYGQAKGGVYPISDDQICPDGCEQPGWAMPWADLSINSSSQTASSMGVFDCSPSGGVATTHLAGPYVRVSDNCGAVSESVTCDDDLDLRQSAGIDCAVPPGSSPGNTHSARSSFYHLNRIAEHGRAWLPGNTWLTHQLVDNLNINSTCNAYWGGGSVNFYKSGGGCNNTGEIAGVFLHEWGHGLDENDGGGFDNPSEAYGDITSFMVTHTSCIGRGFFQSGNCSGYGDACLNCSGIRDDDWNQHASHQPHTPTNFAQPNCGGGGGPCGREPHCEGYISAESLWDLAVRDLPATGMDIDSAWQLTDKLWYKSRNGSGGNAYNCSLPNSDGCNSGSWFSKLRTIDDDDGNLSNGTPHAAAIFAAFNRHAIACGNAGDASNQNTSSCPSLPAPTIAAAAGSGSVTVSWTAVPNAASYRVMRNDTGCSHAFTVIATVAAPATSYVDSGLPNAFPLNYRVEAVGANSSCDGPVSTCETATPQPYAGTLTLDRATYGCSMTINLTLRDANVGASTVAVQVWSTTEPTPETVVLTEIAPGTSKFIGTIQTTTTAPVADGKLSLADSNTITARYFDGDDGIGGHNIPRLANAVGDCLPPTISAVGSVGVTATEGTVSWSTDQSSDSRLTWGPSRPPTTLVSNGAMTTAHAVPISGLQACTVYYYQVGSTDPSGNGTTDTNAGQYYHFETLGNFPGTGLQPCHAGQVYYDKPAYACSDAILAKVIDIDLNVSPSIAETVTVYATSTSEVAPEQVVLTETGPNTSIFTASLPTDGGTAAHDGLLQVHDGDVITIVYHDVNDGTGVTHLAYSSSTADCKGPAITALQVTDQPPFRAMVTWTTSEPATGRIDYGNTTALGKLQTNSALTTSHTFFIADNLQCAQNFFKVSSTDARGNTVVEDRGGSLHSFETGRVPGAVFVDGFEASTGWSLNGEWQIGSPMGLGGGPNSSPDPASAWSGSKVLGVDLTGLGSFLGDYEANVTLQATSPVMDLRLVPNAQLIIHRWLNVDDRQHDTATIEGNKRGAWTEIWGNPNSSDTSETAWSTQSYDITSVAGGNRTFQLRFTISSGPFRQLSGWNIDDIVIKDATKPNGEACGSCATKPSFAGLVAATDVSGCGDTGIALSWQSPADWGSGASGTFAVYRDTTPGFTPSASNRIASGLSVSSYTDSAAPNGVTLYYLVRAENNETCSSGPANGGVQDDNTAYRSVHDELSQPNPADIGSSVRGTVVNGVHVRMTWSSAAGAVTYRVYRADNPRMIGSVVAGSPPALFFDDAGEMANGTSRYYLVRGANSCGIEGP